MAEGGRLLVVHVDGLSRRLLLRAVELGHMPFVGRLIANEGYDPLAYRCGVPSTTPFAQAGILYGDNDEIPSYRWWDKATQTVVQFGSGGTFQHVANRYFHGRRPLTEGGACIAALYRAGASDRFGPAYEERHRPDQPDAGGRAIAAFLLNPLSLYRWIRHGGFAIFRIAREYVAARLARRRVAAPYVIADVYHEVLVHHLTRFALLQAIGEGVPAIYACFYTYDEAAHAFGPDDPNTLAILRHVDATIRVAYERATPAGYSVVVLSDHGQVECSRFTDVDGKTLGTLVAGWLPDHAVEEHRGPPHPVPDAHKGRVALTYSGGLAHLYFAHIPGRMSAADVDSRYPGLVEKIAALDRVGLVLLRDGDDGGTLVAGGRRWRLDAAAEVLAAYDEPAVLGRQLARVNSFTAAGDIVIFGAYDGRRQVNFEDQVGGHGSIGGDQLHPFLLARREWGFDTAGVESAEGLYPLLMSLRDQ